MKKPCDCQNSMIEKFENFVLTQESNVVLEDFDRSYFLDAWRANHSAYTVESRRGIEGKNPSLIKEVLKPINVIDVGCGPGILVELMRELNLDAIGVDASFEAIQASSPRVRPFLSHASASELPMEDDSVDLVVCREVLEHLTVLEVFQAVSEMCRVSSRLVYITTRFAKYCESIFDVESELEVDPTHITCLNKSMLRLFFVLNGFECRSDLESLMDWQEKGRVLIYERRKKNS